ASFFIRLRFKSTSPKRNVTFRSLFRSILNPLSFHSSVNSSSSLQKALCAIFLFRSEKKLLIACSFSKNVSFPFIRSTNSATIDSIRNCLLCIVPVVRYCYHRITVSFLLVYLLTSINFTLRWASFAADFRAKLFQLRESGKDFPILEVLYSLKSLGSPLFSNLSFYSLRTSEDSSITKEDDRN